MKRREFSLGIHDGMPICLGYFSVSMAFGLAAVNGGLPMWSAIIISLTNLTSAGQFAGANLIIENAALVEIAMTTLIINIRYFLMSLSVSQKLDKSVSLAGRCVISFGITVEIFAVSDQRKSSLTLPYMLGLILMPLIGWTGGTAFGAVASSLMPEMLTNALGIALYGMFIAIIIPPAREQRSVLFTVVLAVVLGVAFYYLPLLKEISSGWSVIIITIIVCTIAALLFPIREEEEGGEQ